MDNHPICIAEVSQTIVQDITHHISIEDVIVDGMVLNDFILPLLFILIISIIYRNFMT